MKQYPICGRAKFRHGEGQESIWAWVFGACRMGTFAINLSQSWGALEECLCKWRYLGIALLWQRSFVWENVFVCYSQFSVSWNFFFSINKEKQSKKEANLLRETMWRMKGHGNQLSYELKCTNGTIWNSCPPTIMEKSMILVVNHNSHDCRVVK